MERNAAASASIARQTLTTERGHLCRCVRCGGLHFKFGNLSARLNAESFLRLADRVHYAAIRLGPKLAADEHIVIPFGAGHFSLLLDSDDLADLHRLVLDGLKWLDEQGEDEKALPVH